MTYYSAMSTTHTHDHVLPQPTWVLVLRAVQLVTAIIVLGLAAYGITYLSFDGDDMNLFTVSPWSL